MRTASLGLSCRAIFLTFLLLQLGLIQLAIAGDFTTAASLATARYGHTSTLLTNGKVLVVGGYGSSGNLASAELYDPVNNSWSSAGSMVLPRVEHTATLLTNGKVLVAGGNNSGGNLGFAELYDPATNSWSYGGSMINGRNQHTATLLSNGKVLFTGGGYYSYQNGINYYYTHGFAELYDPASNSWSSAGTMNFVSFAHTATLLSNGKVLIAGGQNRYYYHGSGQYYTQSVNSVQLYDPSANSWFPAGNMANTRAGHTATLLNNGKVMVIGGANWYGVWNNYAYYYMQYGGDQNSCEIYDPVTNGWQTASSMVETRSGHTSTTLHSGKILVSGGVNLASAELYDPESNTWTYPAGNLATARVLHGATLLPGWKVLISGGWNSISGSTTVARPVPWTQDKSHAAILS